MIIAIDIGGTKTLVALFNNSMEVIKSIKFKTPVEYPDFLAELKRTSLEFPLDDIEIGAIGSRGFIDRTNGLLVFDDKLSWKNTPLVADCQAIFGCSLTIENDSKLAGLSEARAVDMSQYPKVAYVTISTGIGSAVVINGHLDQNMINSEVGKWLVHKDGKLQPWEDTASGSWIRNTYGLLASEIDDPMIWQEIVDNLAPGFVNIAAAYTPDLIVVGGGVGSHFEKFGALLQEKMAQLAHPMVSVPPVIGASYPEDAVIYGCYHSARDQLLTQ